MPSPSPVSTPTGCAGCPRGPWYVGAAVSTGPSDLRVWAALAAASLALAAAGCGGGERRDAGAASGTYAVDIVRAAFPEHQHLADKPTLAITVRNSGDRTIPNLAVTVHGLTARTGGSADADPRNPIWLIDQDPPGAVTAVEDTWAAGALAPGDDVTLRWHVTAVSPGTHDLDYAVAADLAGGARTSVAGGGRQRGVISVHVDARPPNARVDPSTGRVIRE